MKNLKVQQKDFFDFNLNIAQMAKNKPFDFTSVSTFSEGVFYLCNISSKTGWVTNISKTKLTK